jgi:hypothetical protein
VVLGGAAAAQTPTLLGYDGHRWKALSEEAKMALLSGFLIGAAFEQGVGAAAGDETPAPEALEALRRQGGIRFRFAPNVYKARLEDFYRYEDRLPVPVYRALFLINEQILRDAGPR